MDCSKYKVSIKVPVVVSAHTAMDGSGWVVLLKFNSSEMFMASEATVWRATSLRCEEGSPKAANEELRTM